MQLAERNYEIYDKKLLAIVEALPKWRQYLLDAMEHFEIWMDHKNLKVFPRTIQVEWKTSKIVLKVTRLQFYLVTHSRKDKYQGRHTIKERPS